MESKEIFSQKFTPKDTLSYARRTGKLNIKVLILAGLVAFSFSIFFQNHWGWLEPLTGIATLLVAIGVWWGEVKQDMENALPKRLNVRFLFEGKEIMRCDQAYLAGESDIRAWGQQIGRQLVGGILDFAPDILQTPGIVTDENVTPGGGPIKLYEVTFKLTKNPFGSDRTVKIWQYNPSTGEFSKLSSNNSGT